MSLHYDESEPELEIDNVDTPAPVHPMPLPFFTPAETMASPPEDDDNISLVSVTSASRRNAMPTSVRQDFPQVMTIAPPPPKPVSQGRVLRPILSTPSDVRVTHPPWHLTVCSGIVATTSKDKLSCCLLGVFPQGAGSHGGFIPWHAPH